MLDDDIVAVRLTSHGRHAPTHGLAQVRIRSLSSRPVGPLRVVPVRKRVQRNTNHHQ